MPAYIINGADACKNSESLHQSVSVHSRHELLLLLLLFCPSQSAVQMHVASCRQRNVYLIYIVDVIPVVT
uniref:Uncharacterized protein n=1 Tax=Anguilla anguilla TaxID=7936 RepID=A0A0E9P6H7_ANGAN